MDMERNSGPKITSQHEDIAEKVYIGVFFLCLAVVKKCFALFLGSTHVLLQLQSISTDLCPIEHAWTNCFDAQSMMKYENHCNRKRIKYLKVNGHGCGINTCILGQKVRLSAHL